MIPASARFSSLIRVAAPTCTGVAALALWPSYDFICDDAFIALRYAANLARHGAPVYNLDEAVEGYSSFSWVVLLAAPLALGAEPRVALSSISRMSSVALLFSTAYLWYTFRRAPPSPAAADAGASTSSLGGRADERHAAQARSWVTHLGCWASLALLLLSAPVGAWAFGGLETPLFSALCTLGIALSARVAETRQPRHGLLAGLAFGAAALTRPETPLILACCALPLVVISARQVRGEPWREVARPVVIMLAVFLVIAVTHLAWRLWYYGVPLPNTFYAKTTGEAGTLLARGLRYTGFTLQQLGLPLAGALALLLPASGGSAGRRVVLWTARLWVPAQVAYVSRVGGDFLDLGRFFVPLLPLLTVSLVDVWCRLLERASAKLSWRRLGWAVALLFALGGAALVGHGWHQYRVGMRALAMSDRAKGKLGIEPLGWTRRAALRWAATGRWLAAHSRERDWMAVGAAGAMPFYAGLPNLDTFGLCDAHVARHGDIVGSRPGHQRFASRRYILSKRPVFIFVGDSIGSRRKPLSKRHRFGEDYVWVRAVVDAERYGAPERFYHQFLMRRDRVREFAHANDLEHQ